MKKGTGEMWCDARGIKVNDVWGFVRLFCEHGDVNKEALRQS